MKIFKFCINSLRNKEKNSKKQLGVILVLMTFLIPVIIFLGSLLLDVGRLFIVVRQAQNIADVISNEGANYLIRDPDSAIYPWVHSVNWANIKPVAKALIMSMKIPGAVAISGSSSFNQGNPTAGDYCAYSSDTMTESNLGAIGPGNLTATVQRGLICYIGSKKLSIVLDNDPNLWCLSNYTQTTLQVSGVAAYLGNLLSTPAFGAVSRTAIAHLRPVPDSCEKPNCSDYSQYLIPNAAEDSLIRVANPVGVPFCEPTVAGCGAQVGTPTATFTPTPTIIATNTATVTITPTSTATAIPTNTPTLTSTPTNTPVVVPPTATNTNTPTTGGGGKTGGGVALG